MNALSLINLAAEGTSDAAAGFEKALGAFQSITTIEILAFLIPFLIAIFVDLNSHKKGQAVTMKDAAIWSVVWVCCSALFAGFVYYTRGADAAVLYVLGYGMEKALAVDNLFAFYLIFKSFGLIAENNQHYQHRILYWGILGAIIFRVFFLGLGAFIVNLSSYVLILFALVVLWTVWKMWKSGDDTEDEVDYSKHWSVGLVRKFTQVNPSIASGRFFSQGATPLFLCLICIEVCDVVFAFDSMPVIIAVVSDPYLMITSSLWAAAGLRSLYFLLVAAQGKFWALDKAVMLLLVFVAFKLIGGAFHFHLAPLVSLSIIGIILTAGILISLFMKEPGHEDQA